MNCDEFKDWLIRADAIEEDAVVSAQAHSETCPHCARLYALDYSIEKLLMEGLNEVDLPDGFVDKIDINLKSLESGRGGYRRLWKRLSVVFVPLAAAAAVLLVYLYPMTWRLQSVDELGGYAVKSHLSDLAIQFAALEVQDVPAWFRERLDYAVSIPDTEGLPLIGGRKCSLGKNDVAYLFFSKGAGKKASVFVIDEKDLAFNIKQGDNYRLSLNGLEVTIWKKDALVYAKVE